MFLGFVKLDDTLLIPQITRNGDTPANADANPTYRIYGMMGGSIVLMTNGTGSMALGDQTAFYSTIKTIASGDGYVAGQTYAMLVSYAISGASKSDLHTFTVY